MLGKISAALSDIPATLVGGAFLLCSFVLLKLGITPPIDPAWVTVFICGIPLLYLAVWRSIHNKGIGKISSAHLICVAMLAAICIGDLFAAGEVAFIMAVGGILEDKTTDRAKKGLKKLIALAPTVARRINGTAEELLAAKELRVGDVIRILPGESIPADGIIVCGETSVDQSIMTGESLPVDKAVGDEIFCGTINRFGAVDAKVTVVGEDSSLQRLIRMVREAEDKKAPMARIADTAASWLVPTAMLIAVAAGLITRDIVRAVTVLVVFCPCALVLATPTAVMAAIGQATKRGVIIKSGEALEKMGKVDTAAFDKTGTLTYGRLEVCDVVSFDKELDCDALLSMAGAAEAKSEHPIGRAVVACAVKRGIHISQVSAFKMTAGRGIYAELGDKRLLCGNEAFVSEHGVILEEPVLAALKLHRECGKATILICENERCVGAVAMSDALRPEAREAVHRLRSMNTDAVLLTGDNRKSAEYFAEQVGVDKVYAQLLPEQKVSSITALREAGHTVCMIGDGVNDAPALKTADVGIAMGALGSDIAVEAADIVLVSDDISSLPYLKRLSDATVKTIKASITLSMCINLAAVTLSVLGLLNPTAGALVHNAGSCFVVLIAALLYDRKFE